MHCSTSGPLSTITTAKLPTTLCADAAYRQMRRDRMLLLNQKAQADQFDRDWRQPIREMTTPARLKLV